MQIHHRSARPDDAAACVALRGRTRENAIPPERLAALGITPGTWAQGIRDGTLPGHLALAGEQIIGYCFGDSRSGEVVVLALLPQAERQGLGKALLARVVADLQGLGFRRLFLGCASDPAVRSHGFYRHLGWRPTGEIDAHGDEVLSYTLPGP